MPDVFNDANRELIIVLAARSGVPAIYPRPQDRERDGAERPSVHAVLADEVIE